MDGIPLATNGTVLVPPAPQEPEDLLTKIQAAYTEVARRDGNAERRAWHQQCLAMVMAGLFVVVSLLCAWLLWARQDVQGYVQVVQVDEMGKVHLLGSPQKLLEYQPDEGMWHGMLTDVVRKVRWRGEDEILAREEWRWAHFHMCKDARAQLNQMEATEKPFVLGARKVAVQLQSITKTKAPRSYNVLWHETVTDGPKQPEVQRWIGTFTVGRTGTPTVESALYNPLALCVTAFSISRQP